MTDQVERVIKLLEELNGIPVLQSCTELKQRYDKLMKLVPETRLWDPTSARQLVYTLYKRCNLDFGVCSFYQIEENGTQYCTIDGEKTECLCVIPQPFCTFRDKDGKPKYPKLLSRQTIKKIKEEDAARLLLQETFGKKTKRTKRNRGP